MKSEKRINAMLEKIEEAIANNTLALQRKIAEYGTDNYAEEIRPILRELEVLRTQSRTLHWVLRD